MAIYLDLLKILEVLRCWILLEEMIELGDTARGPFESAFGVTQVAHDVTVLPAATLRSGSSQVTRWW